MAPRPDGLIEEKLSGSVISAFYEVYNTLGPGFLEHVYSLAIERELIARGHRVAREYRALIYYKGIELTSQRLDMVVDEKLVVELKSANVLDKAAPKQVLSYLRATNLEVGLLLHFGPQAGFFRVVASNRGKPHYPPDPLHQRNPRHGVSGL
jgi:GxxExxY protein